MTSRLLRLFFALSLLAAACGGDSDEDVVGAAGLTADEAIAPDDVESASGDEAPTSTTDAPTTTTTAVPTTTTEAAPVEPDDYRVGVTTFTVDEGSDRPLTVDVWFPLEDGATGDPQQYTLLPGVYYESPDAVAVEPGALTSIAEGAFPLIVYSHGSGGQRWIHSNYTEHLASLGHIVVAPDHTGNTLIERFAGTEIDFEQVAFDRVSDVSSVIDAAVGDDDTEPLGAALAGALTDDVVVTGHSFGGFTAYGIVSGVSTTVGTIEPDDRVDAIITLAPATGGLTDEQLAAVDVPHLVLVGDSDDTTPIDPNVERAWDFVTGTPSYRVELADAEHQTFTDLCAYRDFMPQLETVPEFIIETIDSFAATDCAATAMPLDRAQEITNSFAVDFLDEVLRGGAAIPDDSAEDTVFLSKAS